MTVLATKVDSIIEAPAGAFKINVGSDEKFMIVVCPCGCNDKFPLAIRPAEPEHPSWEWDGDTEKPTLSPSINRTSRCKWHGWLQNGIWKSVNE